MCVLPTLKGAFFISLVVIAHDQPRDEMDHMGSSSAYREHLLTAVLNLNSGSSFFMSEDICCILSQYCF